jgi:S-adenosylmethionine hydrolase
MATIMRPVIGLLTDFGTKDHYVGAVKGAILSVCREASLVDVVHDLPAHDIEAGAYALMASYRAFPEGSVFLAVVDPGVGSERRGIAVDTGAYRFVAPDNGILSFVLAENPGARIHHITNGSLFRLDVSSTFHARDIFGPVAGQLACGLPLHQVGPPLADPVLLPIACSRQVGPGEWAGAVLHVDTFGNLTTSFTGADLDRILAVVDGDPTEIVVVVEGMVIPMVRAYAEVAEGEPLALLGSSGRLEVAVNCGSAASILGARRGAPVRVRTVQPSETSPML